MKELIDMFLTFARVGGFTFGGGYAMIPILQRELVENKKWATEEELMDYYAIGQCTPGIIAVNVSTFIGYKLRGLAGAVFATLGMITPSVVIIMIIAGILKNFMDIPWVSHALAGITVCVCVLILDTVIKLAKKTLKSIGAWIISVIVFCISLFTNVPAAVLVVSAGIVGLAVKTVTSKKEDDADDLP